MPTQAEIEDLLIEEEIARRRALKDFGYFCKLAWHVVEPEVPYVHNWHVSAIGEHLEAVLELKIKNLIINLPPRCSKSSLISVLFPAWTWLKYPSRKFLFASYAASLSVRDSIKCRRLIESDWYRRFFKPDWKMNPDQNRQDEFSNTRQGHRIATSVDGSGTGKGGDIVVIDDPHKAADVYGVQRQNVIDWYDGEMSTRSIDPMKFCRIIVMQRLHPMDLSGHLLARGGYELLKLPMEYEGDKTVTSIGWSDPRTEIGELLSPQRFGPDEILALKRDLGSHGYAGQEQQNPTAFEGGVIKRAWFKYYDDVLPWDATNHIQAWDFAASEKNNADYTVGITGCRKGAQVFIVDMIRGRFAFPDACQALVSFSAKHPKAIKKIVENKSNGIAVIQTLKHTVPGIVEVNPGTDKLSRLNSVAPFIEAGNIYLPKDAPWVNDFLNEVCGFQGEGSGHDDIVDALCYLLNEYANKASHMPSPMAARRSVGYR